MSTNENNTFPSTPIPRNIAEVMQRKIDLLAAKAIGDSAMEKMDELSFSEPDDTANTPDQIIEMANRLSEQFDASEEHVLLEAAFNSLEKLLKTRSKEDLSEEEMRQEVSALTSHIREQQKAILLAVHEHKLPASTSEHYTAALAIASTDKPRSEWIDDAKRRDDFNRGM